MKRINRLIAVLLSLAALITVGSIGASIYFAHQSKETSILMRIDTDVHTLSDNQENMETALATLSSCLSNTQAVSQESTIVIMNSLKEDYGFSFVARTGADGYAFNNEGTTGIFLGERDYFIEGMEGKATTSFINQGLVDATSGYLLTAVPVYRDGKPDGIVHGSYSTATYLSKVEETISDDTLILLLDEDGTILGTNKDTTVSGNITAFADKEKASALLLENLAEGKSSTLDLHVDGIHTCAAYAPLGFDDSNFFVMFATPTSEIPFSMESFWHLAGIMLSANSIVVILLLLASFGLWLFNAQMQKNELEKKHLESLAAEQSMYNTILDETATAIAVVDIKTHEVLYANAVALHLLTDEPDTFIGGYCYSCIAHNDAPCEYCPIKEGVVVQQSREFDIKGHTYHQDFKPILWHGREALVEYNRDITEQKGALLQLEQQKELQEKILDTIPAGIMVFKFTENGIQIVSVNHSILEMMGMDKSKALGDASQNITALTHPDDLQVVLDAAKKLSTPDAYVEYEYRHFFRSRNDYIWVLGQGHSIRNPDGYVYAYINYTDITSRKEVELLQGKLETAGLQAATKAEFYSQMSHDMRTPMNGILGIAELAEKENDVDELHHDIAKIKQSGQYMLNLINDTLDLQRMETGRMKLEPTLVRCQDMLDEVITMVMPSIQEKNISLAVRVLDHSEMNWYVRVDALRIKQIASNIISNSVKYTPAGGKIEICVGELKRDNMVSHVVIQITDSGVGMSKAFLENGIFKPFSQERNEMSMLYPGSGLGLSIVKKLVELMGGTIKVESTLGIGTTFYVYLDMDMVTDEEANRQLNAKSNAAKVSEENLNGKRILLCEDHPLNAEIAQRLLRKVGCMVEWAENGSLGVDLFEKSEPGYYDAVLMDIRMPVMDGLQATKAIRECGHSDAKSVPIIAMSANAYEEDIQKSLQAGMNDHLAKPVNPQKLFDTLAKYLA